MSSGLRRALTVAGLALLAVTATGCAPPAGTDADQVSDAVGRPVVVIAVPGLLWSDVTATGTPAMWALSGRGSTGVLAVKSRWSLAGCADGLLTLGAGNRAAAEPSSAPRAGCGATVSDAAEVAKGNREAGVGALSDSLHAAGVPCSADGPGADLALPGCRATTRVHVALHVLSGLDHPEPATTAGREAAAGDVDRQVAQLLGPVSADEVVMLVGVSDSADADQAHLHVAIVSSPNYPPGYLYSPSTKRSPYSELVDVAPTVLSLVGGSTPDTVVGRVLLPDRDGASTAARVDRLRDLDTKAVLGASRRPPFMWLLSALALVVGLLGLAAGLRPGGGRQGRGRRTLELAAYSVAALPAASWLAQLVPWWRSPGGVVLWPLLAVGALAVGLAAYRVARARPVRGLWLVTAVSLAVLVADLVTGTRLQTAALLGDSPITAGRFYGAGNTAFGVLAVSALLLVVTALAVPSAAPRRRAVRGAAVALGLLMVVALLDAAPMVGADVGGGLALTPALLVGVLLLARVRLTVARVAAVIVVGAVPVVALALWDYHRGPGRRTHIGEFVAQVRDGTAAGVVGRKLSANLHQLVSSPFLPVVLGTVVLIVVVVRSPGLRARLRRAVARTPGLGSAWVAVAVCAVLGGALNDSGVTVTGVMLAVAVPLATALAVRADA